MAHWNTVDNTLWQVQARQHQNQIFATYGDRIWWSGVPGRDDVYLQQSLGYILYGPPPINGIANIAYSGYTQEEVEDIFNFTDIISKHFKGYTYISVVFILTKFQNKTETEGVLRIWNDVHQKFLDSSGKVYTNWSTFLKKNKLPPRYICYPSEGRYKMGIALELCLEYGKTPSFKAPKYYKPSACSSCSFPFKTIFTIFLFILAFVSIYFAITSYIQILYAPAGVFILGGGFSIFRCRRQVGVKLCCCCIQNCCEDM